MPEAVRTLVKSGPELWAQVSDPAALGRLLGGFGGDLAITRAQAERLVAWEAASAAGTLTLEPAGFGTRVRASATVALVAGAPPPAACAPAAPPRLWRRLLRRRGGAAEAVAAPAPPVPAMQAAEAEALLAAALDALGRAHHRPYSRA